MGWQQWRITNISYVHVERMRQIWRHIYIIKRLNYCKSTLARNSRWTVVPHRVQNTAVRIVDSLCVRKYITSPLFVLHWWLVTFKIEHKLCIWRSTAALRAITRTSQTDSGSCVTSYITFLRKEQIHRSKKRSKIVECALSVADQTAWNCLPKEIRDLIDTKLLNLDLTRSSTHWLLPTF